jgi:hypothetical protein
MTISLFHLTLRHGDNIMKSVKELSNELVKEVNNKCLDCPFNMSLREEIMDYCLNECPGGRRDLVNNNDS